MAVSLTEYTGNAGLGLGSNPQTPTTATDPNLNIINQAMRDVMLMNNENNVRIFSQKVQDRNQLNQLIFNNQVSAGDILPKYRDYFDQAKKKAEDAFTSWKGNFNDTEGYRKYQEAIQDLKDISTHAQVNTLELKKLEKEKAAQTLPRKQQEYQRWIEKQNNQPFWNQITPYQQLHDFSIDDISGLATLRKRTIADPNNPLMSYEESFYDYNDILNKARNAFVNDQDKADSIDKFVTQLEEQYDPQQLAQTLDAVNARLQTYNQTHGLVEGSQGYVAPIKTVPEGGRLRINEPKMTLAAKWALAMQDQFSSRTPQFNKDLAKYGLDKDRLALQARKLGIDAAKAGAYIRNLDAKTAKFLEDERASGTDVARQYEDFVEAIKPATLKITQPSGKSERQDIIHINDLPQGYQFINGPVIALDKAGKPTGKITVGKLEPFRTTKDKRPYYIPRYVNSINGEEITPNSDFIKSTFNTWKQGGYVGTVDDMVKTLLKNGGLELTLKGQNGAANYTSMYQSAKAINAAATTRGEENVMNPPASIPDDQEEPE